MAAYAETPPGTASVVYQSDYTWGDADWLAERAERQPLSSPMSVYEVHLGSWRPGLSYRDLAVQLAAYVTDMGFTHVEFLPVAEHPFGGSWGYQVTSYYAPTSRFGAPDDFRFLVDTLHQAGIGIIVDWVPAHFPRDSWALAEFDGTHLYEHSDPRLGSQPDWGTLVFNFGRSEVRNFLVANAIYWLEEFHIDGLRVDAVASMLYLDYSRSDGEWTPNKFGGRENLEAIAFLQEVNATCYKRVPGIMMIAEESTAWPGVSRPVHLGGLGFGFKWNMGWMHDTLEYMRLDPIYRQYHHNEITFSMVYAFSENFVLPLSHDEVVHGKGSLLRKMPGDEWRQFAGLRALFGYMWAHPGKQLIFMGSEFGQGDEWSETSGLEWWLLQFDHHSGVQRLMRDLNAEYRAAPALWSQDTISDGFSWIDSNDAHGNVVSFLRFGGQEYGVPVLACVANFSAMPHSEYRVGLPLAGRWREVLNTDAASYGGSGMGNLGSVNAIPKPWHGLRVGLDRAPADVGSLAGPGDIGRARDRLAARRLGDAPRRPLLRLDGGQDRGERGARPGGSLAVVMLPLPLRRRRGKPGGDGLTFPGSLPGCDEVGGQAGQDEEQQGGERQCHVHAHQVPVDGEQETHIVRRRGEGLLRRYLLQEPQEPPGADNRRVQVLTALP